MFTYAGGLIVKYFVISSLLVSSYSMACWNLPKTEYHCSEFMNLKKMSSKIYTLEVNTNEAGEAYLIEDNDESFKFIANGKLMGEGKEQYTATCTQQEFRINYNDGNPEENYAVFKKTKSGYDLNYSINGSEATITQCVKKKNLARKIPIKK